MQRLISHIRQKLENSGEFEDPFDIPDDEQIKYIMLATLEIVEEECQKCYYCKNYKRFTICSYCRIKPHTQNDCFHFTPDVSKILKKKYYHILITTSECTRGKNIIEANYLTPKTIKNIIYESIRLSESLKDLRKLNAINDIHI